MDFMRDRPKIKPFLFSMKSQNKNLYQFGTTTHEV